jgi:hypothetical protein
VEKICTFELHGEVPEEIGVPGVELTHENHSSSDTGTAGGTEGNRQDYFVEDRDSHVIVHSRIVSPESISASVEGLSDMSSPTSTSSSSVSPIPPSCTPDIISSPSVQSVPVKTGLAENVLGSVQSEINNRIISRASACKEESEEELATKWNPKLFFDPLYNPPPEIVKPWLCSIVVLVPVRLGIQSVNPEYIDELKDLLRNKYSIGFIGGRPNHAIYFVGYKGKATLLGLDPHTTFVSVPKPPGK